MKYILPNIPEVNFDEFLIQQQYISFFCQTEQLLFVLFLFHHLTKMEHDM